jgi:hypothetical protein
MTADKRTCGGIPKSLILLVGVGGLEPPTN